METQQALVGQRGRASIPPEKDLSSHRHPKNRRPPSATSKTPRRRNTNPQSSSPPRTRADADDDANDNTTHVKKRDDTHDESPQTSQPTPLISTPLHTLTSLLLTSQTTTQTTLQLFRTSHSLHLHALQQKTKAAEAFRLAQAEFEHATTAEEFARGELECVRVQKDEVNDAHSTLQCHVAKLSNGYRGVRVTLVNLQQNSNWNGRNGTIVKLVTDGPEEDVGRWKVRLDSDWRGKEPDGEYGDKGERVLSQDGAYVMAKAENLKLIDESNGEGEVVPSFLGGGSNSLRSKLKSSLAKSPSSNDSDEDDRGKHHHHQLDPVEELPEESYNPNLVTPERLGGRTRRYNNKSHQPSSPPNEYNWKKNALGTQHSPPGYYESGASIVGDDDQFVQRQETPRQRQRILGHYQQEPKEEQMHQQHRQHHQQSKQTQQQQRQKHYVSPMHQQQQHYVSPRPTRPPKSSPNMHQQPQQQIMYDRNQVSSSFAEMVSPEQFAPISFQIETSESFTQRDVVPPLPPNSSFFEEVSPRHEDAENVPKHHHHQQQQQQQRSYQEGVIDHEDRSSSGRSPQAPLTQQPNSLPTVVVLEEEEEDGNTRNGPPTCVGVQNAGISHVNGLYTLSNQDDSESQPSPNNDIPPLYFREAEPILLSDGRYYDMCILRIDCPDSPEYVIWFLSRVDIDPECLDVKFSDCYYYCRVERSVGLFVPPVDGWNVPDVQQQQQQPGGAVEFGTVEDKEDHRVENEHDLRLHDSSMSSGLGIVPRTVEDDDDKKRLASF